MTSSALAVRAKALLALGRRYFPGVLVAAVVGMAATFISDSYGGPVMLLTLLLGMAFVFLSQEGSCPPGIEFASKKILRLGVALLGARITLEQILDLGPTPIIIVIAAVVLTILFGSFVARRLGFSRQFGTLTGGAVAICGASAALAISSVLPKHTNHERDTIFTVISVTTLSTIAMVIYPLLSKLLGFSDTEAGLMLGGTIHDVAQVVGAGYLISDTAGDVSTVTKLFRVALLVPAVLIIAYIFNRGEGGEGAAKLPIPGFLFGFIALVTVNSLGWVPKEVLAFLVDLSRWCLVTAIAALGMKTSIKALADVGGKAVALIVTETLFILAVVVGLLVFVV
jgi:uncharacterized integral membrane protein (TIGR00698 family)